MLWGPGLTLLLLNAQPNLQTSAALAQLAKELNHRRPKGHKNDGWQNKYCQGDYHFNRSFGCLLLRALTALRSQRFRVHAQRRSDACAEAVSLDERSDQSPNIRRRSKPCSTATTPSIPTKASSMRLPTYIVRWRGSR